MIAESKQNDKKYEKSNRIFSNTWATMHTQAIYSYTSGQRFFMVLVEEKLLARITHCMLNMNLGTRITIDQNYKIHSFRLVYIAKNKQRN